MYERPWPVITSAAVGLLVGVLIGWLLLGGTDSQNDQAGQAEPAPVRWINGVPVGVEHSRAGALAAADNYVATSSETVLQDPQRYKRLVRTAYMPSYQATALAEGAAARKGSSSAIENYEAGGRALAVIAARRLDRYQGDEARVTTWTAGFSWGPNRRPGQRWFFTNTRLTWTSDRWRVDRIDESARAAPTPGVVRYADKRALDATTFDRELTGMTAPSYGVEAP
jgi:hypothetical protein